MSSTGKETFLLPILALVKGNGFAVTFDGMAIGKYQGFVIDCRDAGALAVFNSALLDWKVKVDGDWAEIRSQEGNDASGPDGA